VKNAKYLIAVLFFLILPPHVLAEEIYDLFVPSNSQAINNQFGKHQQRNKGHEKFITRGKYNSSIRNISASSRLRIKLPDQEITLKVNLAKKKGKNRFLVSASKTDSKDTLNFAENNGNIVGSLNHNGKLYKLRPDSSGEIIITEIPLDTLIDHEESYYNNMDNFMDTGDPENQTNDASQNIDSGSEFTIIVAYTSWFAAFVGDVQAYMDLLEFETNLSYSNSQINTRVRIVHAYQTSYISPFATPGFPSMYAFIDYGDYFFNTANPETQELHNLRDQYNADIMFVLTEDSYHQCGKARGIGVSENNAIAFARESCAVGYYSFGHEIGHLFGARHIISQDPNTEPFSYGHGYCNVTPNTWRTVMAYNCASETGGPRIMQWSNPNVSINGEPSGTEFTEFNAQVMNVRATEVANFRQSSQPNYMVAAGGTHSCALDDGGAICWGLGSSGQSPAPTNLVNPRQIATGYDNSCVLDDSEIEVTCWGSDAYGKSSGMPAELVNPTQVSLGYQHSCALDDNGVHCWGNPNNNQTNVPVDLANPKHVAAGYDRTCAVDDNGVRCWGGFNSWGQNDVPSTLVNPRQVSVGEYHTCALDDSEMGIQCWGLNFFGFRDVPTGLVNPRQLSGGNKNTCVLDDNGVHCWGWDYFYGDTVPGDLIDPYYISVGRDHACALDKSETGVQCWGSDQWDQSTPPPLNFTLPPN